MHVIRVHDAVAVALFREEALPVLGEIGVDGVARHDGVEVRRPPVRLGSQNPTESLCFFLT